VIEIPAGGFTEHDGDVDRTPIKHRQKVSAGISVEIDIDHRVHRGEGDDGLLQRPVRERGVVTDI